MKEDQSLKLQALNDHIWETTKCKQAHQAQAVFIKK